MASNVDYHGVPGGIRTRDLLLRRQPLYPTELQGRVLSLAQRNICKQGISGKQYRVN
jgi:hypothetical protein